MTRLQRTVGIKDWRLADGLGERRDRLLEVPQPQELVISVIKESEDAVRHGRIALTWQESCDRPGYWRLVAQIPLSETTFDQFFNGRSGYRAQYYLSPEEGVLHNRDVLDGLVLPIRLTYEQRPLTVDWAFVERSMRAPHSKIWIFEEKAAFDAAGQNELNPPRWVEHCATTGRKAPLPSHCTLDVKGAFVRLGTGDLFVDPLKLERPLDLFHRGYT